MSSGTITQLISSGGNANVYMTPDQNQNQYLQGNDQSNEYVCLNQQCIIKRPSKFEQLFDTKSLADCPIPFKSLGECQQVCGVKPSTKRPQ